MAANVEINQPIIASTSNSWHYDNFDLRIKQISAIALGIFAVATYCLLTKAVPLNFTIALFAIGAACLIACLSLKILQYYLNSRDDQSVNTPRPPRPRPLLDPSIRLTSTSTHVASETSLGHRREVNNETEYFEFNRNYQKISFAAPGILRITRGDRTTLKMEGDPQDMDNLDVHPEGENLILGIRPNSSFQTTRPITYDLTTPNISEITHSGTGEIVVDGIRGNSFTCSVNGSGDLQASGEVVNLNINISGSGNVKCQNLTSQNGIVSITRGGIAHVNTTNRLQVNILGAGSCHYANNPVITQNIRGAGRLIHT
jgi:hypothetical protein